MFTNFPKSAPRDNTLLDEIRVWSQNLENLDYIYPLSGTSPNYLCTSIKTVGMRLRGTHKSTRHLNLVVRKRWRCRISESYESQLLILGCHASSFVIVTGADPYSYFGYVMAQHISAQVKSVTQGIDHDSLVCIQ